MSFTPSENFTKRWLDSPVAIKQAIHDELDDIINLLDTHTVFSEFRFRTPDLAQTLHHLQTAHLQTLKLMAQKQRQEHMQTLLPILNNAIDDKLSQQLIDYSDELKAWLRQLIQDELNKINDDKFTV